MELNLEQLKAVLEDPKGTRPKYIKIRSTKFPFLQWLIDVEEGSDISKSLGLQMLVQTHNGVMIGYDLAKQKFIDVSPADFQPSPLQKLLPILIVGAVGVILKKTLKG